MYKASKGGFRLKMKKIISSLIVGVMTLALGVGCNQSAEQTKVLKVAALNGPTGMGMVQLLEDKEQYEVTLYQSPDEIVGKVVSGEVDLACVPSNMGAVLYNKTQKAVSLVGINTQGVLYIVENGNSINNLEDLKGKTIIASGKGGTPEYVLTQLLKSAGLDPEQDVTIDYLTNHTDVVTKLVAEEGTIALLPEPHVTIATTKQASLLVAVDLNEAWQEKEGSTLPMGVILAQNTLVKEDEEALSSFLKDYEASVNFVNEKSEEAAALMEKYGIIAKKEIAIKAIPNCHIVLEQGETAKIHLETFYKVLEALNPKAIGGTLPDEAFYYNK